MTRRSVTLASLISVGAALAGCSLLVDPYGGIQCDGPDQCASGLRCWKGRCEGTSTNRCGDYLAEGSEVCDDGGESSVCDVDCTRPTCGDGLTNASAGEACETHESLANGACTEVCLVGCEPGFLDANRSSADGCEAAVSAEPGAVVHIHSADALSSVRDVRGLPDGSVLVTGAFCINGPLSACDGTFDAAEDRSSAGASDLYVARYDDRLLLDTVFVTGSSANEEATAVALAGDGGYGVAGSLQGQVDFTVATLSPRSGASRDAFVVRFRASAQPAWADVISGGLRTEASGLGFQSDGGAVVVGSACGGAGPCELYATGGAPSPAATSDHLDEGFAVAYDGVGNVRWAHLLMGPGVERITAVAPVADGGALVAGHFCRGAGSTCQANLGISGPLLVSQGTGDAFVARLGADGSTRWLRTVGSDFDDDIVSMAALPDGSAYVVGSFCGDSGSSACSLHFVDDAGISDRASRGQRDGWLGAIDPDGRWRWVRTAGGPSSDEAGTDVAITPDGGGLATLSICYPEGAGCALRIETEGVPFDAGSNTSADGMVVGYARDGSFLFEERLASDDAGGLGAIDVLADQRVLLGGFFRDRATFPGLGTVSEPAPLGRSFVGRLSWAQLTGG